MGDTKEIVVPLTDIHYLFTAPEPNPFSMNEDEASGTSGLELITNRLEAMPRDPALCKLILQLPSEKIEQGIKERTSAALKRYCELKIRENDIRRKSVKRQGLRSLSLGLVFLGISLIMAALFGSELLTFIPLFIRSILKEGFTIIGWVILWRPVEIFFFDPREIRQENKIYRFIESMDLEIRAAG